MFRLEFETTNAAFDNDAAAEVEWILRTTADKIAMGDYPADGEGTGGPIHDANGNRVGFWRLDP